MANTFSVPASGSSAALFVTAIAGANPTPYGSAALTQSANLTTGDLNVGDAGELGGLNGFALEGWFMIQTAYPGVDNTIIQGPVSNSGASRQYNLALLAAGNLSFGVLDDGAAVRTATGSTVLQLSNTGGSPLTFYHVVCTAEGGNLNIYVNGVLDGTTSAWSTHTVRQLGTTAGSMALTLLGSSAATPTLSWNDFATYRTGLTAARVLEHYNAGVNHGWFAQLPGQRITAALDAVSSHAPRSIQAGTRTVIPSYMSGQAPIEEIRTAVEAEDVDAGFFAAKNGTLTFLADGYRSASPYNTSQVTLGDGGGAEIPYQDMTMDYSESFLINEWNVTRSDYASASNLLPPATQTASDATSISRYFKRSQSLAGVPVTLDSDCATIATELLAKYKDPMQRVTSVTMQASAPDTTAAGLARDLADRITVKRRPPGGGSPISQDVFIEKIDISGSNDGAPWVFNWGVSPQ